MKTICKIFLLSISVIFTGCGSTVMPNEKQSSESQSKSPIIHNEGSQRVCPMNYDPVCVTLDNGKKQTIGNSCHASGIANVSSVAKGACD